MSMDFRNVFFKSVYILLLSFVRFIGFNNSILHFCSFEYHGPVNLGFISL